MTAIEWTDRVWNPVVGCTRVSAGCDNCYAIRIAGRQMSPQHRGLTKLRPKGKRRGLDWNGEVRTVLGRLAEPMRWRTPQKVFVNSMSDLFHKRVPYEFIAAVFGVMAAAPRHTFQVLTKRDPRPFFEWAAGRIPYFTEHGAEWPLPNVWLGVSAEDQATWDERVPMLLECPAAIRFVSAEPLLGPIDSERSHVPSFPHDTFCALRGTYRKGLDAPSRLDWVIVGGESGAGARPCRVDWIRSIVRQCRSADVPVFVKQLGRVVYDRNDAGFNFTGANEPDYWPESIGPDDVQDDPRGFRERYQGAPVRIRLQDRKGKDMKEWPECLRVRQFPVARQETILGVMP